MPFFKSKKDPENYAEVNSNFARRYLPMLFEKHEDEMIEMILSGKGRKVIRNYWAEFIQVVYGEEHVFKAKELEVSGVEEDGQYMGVIVFNQPKETGQPMLAFIPILMIEGDIHLDYFLFSQVKQGMVIEFQNGDDFKVMEVNPELEREDCQSHMFKEYAKLKPQIIENYQSSSNIVEGPPLDDSVYDTARQTFPPVLERFKCGELPGLSVKVAVPVDKGSEHVWVEQLELHGDVLKGAASCDGVQVGAITDGMRVSVPIAKITDWTYLDTANKMQGNYTLRALLPTMPPEQAVLYKDLLA